MNINTLTHELKKFVSENKLDNNLVAPIISPGEGFYSLLNEYSSQIKDTTVNSYTLFDLISIDRVIDDIKSKKQNEKMLVIFHDFESLTDLNQIELVNMLKKELAGEQYAHVLAITNPNFISHQALNGLEVINGMEYNTNRILNIRESQSKANKEEDKKLHKNNYLT